MASYEYQYYVCPQCSEKLSRKTCPDCNVKTKGQGKVSMRFRIIKDYQKIQTRTRWYDTKREAREEYLTTMANAPKIDLQAREAESYLFEDLLKKHLADNALNTRRSTAYDKERVFEKHILPFFKGKDVRKIKKKDVLTWQTLLFSTTYKRIENGEEREVQITNKYAKKIRGYLNTFFDWLYDYYEILNLLKTVKAPKNIENTKKRDFLELHEFKKLDEVSKDDVLWNTMFCFMYHTGMRPGEVRAFAEADYSNGEVSVNKTFSRKKTGTIITAPKNNKTYTKPIDSFLIKRLEKYLKWKRENNLPSDFLFVNHNGKPISKTTLSCKLKKYMKLTDIQKNITPHSFRHSYVSMLIDMDCSTKTVAEMIGDTEEVVMRTYSHLYTTKKKQTIDKLNEYLSKK